MYERSAIVLERYFDNILGYASENNLKVNFDNFCNLVEKLDKYQSCYSQEQSAIQGFDEICEAIKSIQKSQEKLYKKSAKFEFNRNLLFNTIEENPEETEKCILKIEQDIEKNIQSQKDLRVKFIDSVKEYNTRKSFLNKSKKERNIAQKEYEEILEIARANANSINEFILEFARNFTGQEIKEKLVALMLENGKNEKIPFDEEVINHAADLGLDIAQREVECYVEIYDNTFRLFDEIDKDEVKLDKFKKRIRNMRVKLNFLFAEKEYLVQFLDYERITVVNGKRAHKKLMTEACENLLLDVVQINNLYELILREIAYKSTKKGYKELYNKSYLIDIKEKEAKFKKEKNRVNLNTGTILNSNYWRIEGIKNIYTVFYNDISEVFGRDLIEFDVPEEDDENIEQIEVIEPKVSKKKTSNTKKIEKQPETIVENSLEELDNSELPQLVLEEENESVKDSIQVIEESNIVEEVIEKEINTLQEKDNEITFKSDIAEYIEESVEEITDSGTVQKIDIQNEDELQEENILEESFNNQIQQIEANIEELEQIETSIEELEQFESELEFDSMYQKSETEYVESKVENIETVEDVIEKEDIESIDEDIFEEEQQISKNVSFMEEDIPYEEDEQEYELEDEEESLFGNIKTARIQRKNKITVDMIEQLEKENKTSKKGLFNGLRKLNSKDRKKATNE